MVAQGAFALSEVLEPFLYGLAVVLGCWVVAGVIAVVRVVARRRRASAPKPQVSPRPPTAVPTKMPTTVPTAVPTSRERPATPRRVVKPVPRTSSPTVVVTPVEAEQAAPPPPPEPAERSAPEPTPRVPVRARAAPPPPARASIHFHGAAGEVEPGPVPGVPVRITLVVEPVDPAPGDVATTGPVDPRSVELVGTGSSARYRVKRVEVHIDDLPEQLPEKALVALRRLVLDPGDKAANGAFRAALPDSTADGGGDCGVAVTTDGGPVRVHDGHGVAHARLPLAGLLKVDPALASRFAEAVMAAALLSKLDRTITDALLRVEPPPLPDEEEPEPVGAVAAVEAVAVLEPEVPVRAPSPAEPVDCPPLPVPPWERGPRGLSWS